MIQKEELRLRQHLILLGRIRIGTIEIPYLHTDFLQIFLQAIFMFLLRFLAFIEKERTSFFYRIFAILAISFLPRDLFLLILFCLLLTAFIGHNICLHQCPLCIPSAALLCLDLFHMSKELILLDHFFGRTSKGHRKRAGELGSLFSVFDPLQHLWRDLRSEFPLLSVDGHGIRKGCVSCCKSGIFFMFVIVIHRKSKQLLHGAP